jgi:hypothetical protein
MFPITPLAAALGIGVLIIGTLTFWAALQNWLADLIHAAQNKLGFAAETLQNALIIVDRVVVNGQRVIVATARALFKPAESEPIVAEEARVIPVEELPPDVRARLEAGQPITYELSVGSMQMIAPPPARQDVTYKLAVRRLD